MSRMYSVIFDRVAVSAVQDLFELTNAATTVLKIHSVELGQDSDEQDAEDEQLQIKINRRTGSPTSGSGGSSATPVKMQTGDAAASFTAEVNNTTQISAGTETQIYSGAFNIRAGFFWTPTPECRPVIAPSEYFIVELGEAPADAITMSGTIMVEEIG